MRTTLLLLLAAIAVTTSGQRVGNKADLRLTPKAPGTPTPLPQVYTTLPTQHVLDERAFSFQYMPDSVVCNMLSNAFNRYYKIIFRPQEYEINEGRSNRVKTKKRGFGNDDSRRTHLGVLKRVVIYINMPCEDYPSLDSDESYTLQVAGDFASIESKTLWGTLRGLETFSQLVIEDSEGTVRLLKNDSSFILFQIYIIYYFFLKKKSKVSHK